MESQRVFLHVGAPKTGTTFVQGMLFHYRDRLRAQGILYPADTYDEHFFAAVDLQDLEFSGYPRPAATGAWERVAARVRAWPGTSIISHDVFAGATHEQVQHAWASLGVDDVHVIYNGRDLARQLPSHWQEDVKHGQQRTFGKWFDAISTHDDTDWHLRWFWRTQDIPDVMRRWGATLPPERVHLLTVPPSGASEDLLWRRFAKLIGIDPDAFDPSVVAHPNAGLGVAEVELLRRINLVRDDRLDQVEHEHLVKGVLGHELLPHHYPSRRIGLPVELRARVRTQAKSWVAMLESAGYDVIGDLTELLPAPIDRDRHHPDSATTDEVAEVAVHAVGELIVRLRDERRDAAEREAALLDRLRVVEGRLAEHRELPSGERIKRTVVEIGRGNRGVAVALGAYRRLRRRTP